MSVVALHEPLKLERDPFAVSVSGVHISHPLRTAFSEIMHHIGGRTPVILVTGNASTGKTLLVDMTARACAEKGLSVKRVDRGDFLPMVLRERCDVLLVDEANSVADSLLDAFSSEQGKNAATAVFLGLPSCLGRLAFSKLHPVRIELAAFPASDARSYLLELAKNAGLPELFTNEALDLIVSGSQGSPRLLRSVASLAYFGAVSDRAPQISLKYATSALVGQVPSAGLKLDKAAPGIVRAHEVPVRQKRSTEIPAYIRRATSESVDGLTRQRATSAEQRKSVETQADKHPSPQETKPAQDGNAVETPANTQTVSRRVEAPAREDVTPATAQVQQARENIIELIRPEETPAEQQRAPETLAVAQQIPENVELPPDAQVATGSIEDVAPAAQQSAGEIATDTQHVPETFEAPAPEEATSAEQQNAIGIAADTEGVTEIVDEPVGEELAAAEQQNLSQEATDSVLRIAQEEHDGNEPVEESTDTESADTESTEELASDSWALAEDQQAIAIPVDNEAIAENTQGLEGRTQARVHLSAQPLSDAPSFSEAVWGSTEQEPSAQNQTDADLFQTTSFSTRSDAPRRAIPSNLKYLGVVAVCILIAAVAAIATVVPSMLASNSDFATVPISAPVPAQASSIAASPPAVLPPPAPSRAQAIPQAARIPLQTDIALAAKETPDANAAVKSAVPAVADVKRSARRPLTDEEKAAVARGLRELERAASQGAPRR